MATLTETTHAGGFILSEANGNRSRENGILNAGNNLEAGAVLGRILYTQAAAPNPAVTKAEGSSANGVMTNVKPGPLAQVGNYVVTCITAAANGGVFSVTSPDGTSLPNATLASGSVAYKSEHIDFTIADGSNDFKVGDKFTVAITAAAAPTVVGTGDGTMSAVSLGRSVKPGTYRVECATAATNAGTFHVIDPDGNRLGDLVLATATPGSFTSEQVSFTITDGDTDFAAGDYFHIVVARGSNYGQYTAVDPTKTDGSQIAAAILYAAVDATAADAACVVVDNDAEVNQHELVWPDGITAAQQAAAVEQLNSRGIFLR